MIAQTVNFGKAGEAKPLAKLTGVYELSDGTELAYTPSPCPVCGDRTEIGMEQNAGAQMCYIRCTHRDCGVASVAWDMDAGQAFERVVRLWELQTSAATPPEGVQESIYFLIGMAEAAQKFVGSKTSTVERHIARLRTFLGRAKWASG